MDKVDNGVYRIGSFDVGIKNLAYCILEKKDNSVKIKKWDIINLIDSNNISCIANKKSGKKCTNQAILQHDDMYLCKQHKSEYNPFVDGWEGQYFKEGIGKCTYNVKNDTCNKNSKKIHKDGNVYCTTHYKTVLNRIKKDIEMKPIKRIKCTTSEMDMLCETMYRKIDNIPELLDVDEILIENQPSRLNPHMKTIASFLFSYFIMRGIYEKKNDSHMTKVKFFSPSNKLKVNEDNTIEVLTGKKGKDKYKMTKQLGEKYTRILLNNEKDMIKHMDTNKKKDDLCDAYLQGYYYLSKKFSINITKTIVDEPNNSDHEDSSSESDKKPKHKKKIIVV